MIEKGNHPRFFHLLYYLNFWILSHI